MADDTVPAGSIRASDMGFASVPLDQLAATTVIHVDFFNKCKKKAEYPLIIKPVYGEDLQD